jgi:hypothetical protein
MKTSELKPNPRNPRKISDAKLTALARSMDKFGDLSGIVYNRKTDRLVGGHQRLKNIPPEAEISIVERLDKPTKQRTIARGFVSIDGELWTYREVDADEQWEYEANVAANKHGGDFSFPELPNLLSELDAQGTDLELIGFDTSEAERLLAYNVAPEDFPEYGEDIDVAHQCPKCGYEWSGKPA